MTAISDHLWICFLILPLGNQTLCKIIKASGESLATGKQLEWGQLPESN